MRCIRTLCAYWHKCGYGGFSNCMLHLRNMAIVYVLDMLVYVFGLPEGGPYFVFTFTTSIWNVWNDISLTWQTLSQGKIFWLYFGEIRLFVPDFINEESFRPEEFFEVFV